MNSIWWFKSEFTTTRGRSRVPRGHLGESAIIEIGISTIEQQIPNTTPEIRSSLIRILSDYIKQYLTYNQAHATFVSFTGIGEPVDRIREIIEVSDEPIAFNEEDVNNSNDSGDAASNSRRKMRTWSSYEDVRLLAGIYRYGIDNWAPISKFVGNGRTRAQCAQRWARGLNPRICKDTWDQNEDLRLMQLVQQYGDKSWTRIAASLGNRSDVQCRYHYHQITKDINQIVQISRPPITNSTPSPTPPTPPPVSTAQIPAFPPPQFQIQPHSQSPAAAFPAFSDTINSNSEIAPQQIQPLQNQPLVPRPFPVMRAPLRFSMPKINPTTPLFKPISEPQLFPPPPSEAQLQQDLDEFQTSDNGSQQYLPKIINHSHGTTRRASHFVIPPIDPKFEMPMKVNPIRFEQIEKLDQQKSAERKSSFTSNIDDFLNKFQ